MLSRACLMLVLLLTPTVARAEADAPPPEDSAPEDSAPDLEVPADTPIEDSPPASTSLADDLRQREELRPWHILFGTASVASMYATTILGFLTYGDRYGFDGSLSSGCATGSPVFGMAACSEPPLAHAIAAFTGTALFSVTFSLALFMPDPLGAGDGDGELATMLTVHRALRWGLAGLFLAQLVLGIVTSSIDTDFGTQRDIATAHLALGTITTVGMSTQGILGSVMAW